LLADEPTGNLDRASALEIISVFQTLNRTGRTIVLITHDREIASFAGRIVNLERGHRVGDDTVVRTTRFPQEAQ
jgi:ABC-type lipoprotein export system ATPase subunit